MRHLQFCVGRHVEGAVCAQGQGGAQRVLGAVEGAEAKDNRGAAERGGQQKEGL